MSTESDKPLEPKDRPPNTPPNKFSGRSGAAWAQNKINSWVSPDDGLSKLDVAAFTSSI